MPGKQSTLMGLKRLNSGLHNCFLANGLTRPPAGVNRPNKPLKQLLTFFVRFHFLLGESAQGRLLFVSYMERNNSIRLISAREATLSERKAYEQE